MTCKCETPLLGERPGVGPRCRLCNCPVASERPDALQQAREPLDLADQAVWDAAWALHDPVSDGRQWKRSQALKEAIDALLLVQRQSLQSQEKK